MLISCPSCTYTGDDGGIDFKDPDTGVTYYVCPVCGDSVREDEGE